MAAFVALLPVFAAAQQRADATQGAVPEEDRRYTVEIILFRYTSEVTDGGEVFPPDEPVIDDAVTGEAGPLPDGAPDADRPPPEFSDRTRPDHATDDVGGARLDELLVPANIALVVLPPDQRTLEAEYDKLLELDAYRPVLWTGWTQSTFEKDVTPSIRLRRLGDAPLSFDGTLELYLSRFLHLVVDLSLEAPGQPAARVPEYGDARYGSARTDRAAGTRPAHFRIQEDRIVKSGELRYFDHPKFGLLARVTRVESAPDGAADGADTGDRGQ